MVKDVTYGKLRDVLASIGYAPEDARDGIVVFRNPKRRLIILLRKLAEDQFVRPIDLFTFP